ncbi:PREDICTED: TSC22 domain family protein 1-like isoform X1 [Cyphomyrmex costatus]|uniref:TSC22 domain family protein 1-like isoform X1 n=1 Tax=Cyphomyrmex costatus TaxID=456900 RepID=UPI0008523AE2|nr:PREDICTED: TSC22 domain family protein 1-like isoform X1 [Cyphomyrmex costatus]XP_018405219.1 PREDICTED: TSC22 domain family protein 1-like isoform X1 [Cyphomyrmex costatus]XP_018405225.1 PREDICTED: TSC22 domain family protein 1-like isoform X1 [Cyphomyrmex costatus]
MAMVSMNNLLNGKDSRWLQLEVCREFQRNKCTRPDTECKFAHPPANVEVQNGRVTACYDSIKGRCNREKPPCKYFHPPQHLKDQLLINGRNHLALKNALMQQIQQGLTPGQTLVPGQVPAVEASAPPAPHHHLQQQIQQQLLATHAFMATNPYLTGMPQVSNTYSPYFAPSPIMPAIMGPADPTGVGSPLGVVPQTVAMPQKMPRTDRLEMDMKSVGSFYYENFAFPGMVPYKRPAADKSGVPVYQPTGATTYQQLMQLQQPFVPVSCEYTGTPPLPTQTSNQSVVQPPNVQSNHHAMVVQSSSSQGAAGATVNNCADANNGVLMDPNNPPPPPPTADNNSNNSNGNNKQPVTTQNHDENSRNSPELNHSSPSSLQQQQQQQQQQQVSQQHQQQQQQINQLALSPAMSPLTSMAGLTSMPGMVNMASMASMASMANMSSITNITSVGNYNTASNMAGLNVLNSLGMASGLPAPLDPATLAKEVAQKNYAKALKLSQVSQSYGIGQLALNYTGVALNKQNLMNPAAAAAGNPAMAAANLQATAATPRPVISGLAGIPGALTSPLSAGILAYSRPPPTATPINPYSLIRQQILPNPYVQASIPTVPGAATVQTNPYVQNPYAVLPAVASVPGVAAGVAAAAAAAGVPQIPQIGNPATIAAQPQVAIPVSSGVIMQPYKKMKTS